MADTCVLWDDDKVRNSLEKLSDLYNINESVIKEQLKIYKSPSDEVFDGTLTDSVFNYLDKVFNTGRERVKAIGELKNAINAVLVFDQITYESQDEANEAASNLKAKYGLKCTVIPYTDISNNEIGYYRLSVALPENNLDNSIRTGLFSMDFLNSNKPIYQISDKIKNSVEIKSKVSLDKKDFPGMKEKAFDRMNREYRFFTVILPAWRNWARIHQSEMEELEKNASQKKLNSDDSMVSRALSYLLDHSYEYKKDQSESFSVVNTDDSIAYSPDNSISGVHAFNEKTVISNEREAEIAAYRYVEQTIAGIIGNDRNALCKNVYDNKSLSLIVYAEDYNTDISDHLKNYMVKKIVDILRDGYGINVTSVEMVATDSTEVSQSIKGIIKALLSKGINVNFITEDDEITKEDFSADISDISKEQKNNDQEVIDTYKESIRKQSADLKKNEVVKKEEETEHKSALDRAMEPLDAIIKFSDEHILFDRKLHKYRFYWREEDKRRDEQLPDEKRSSDNNVVATYTASSSRSSSSEESSTPTIATQLGLMVDKITREYFDKNDPEYRKTVAAKYNKAFGDVITGLENLRREFEKRYGKDNYRVITKEFYLFNKIKNKDQYIAGSPDMVVVSVQNGKSVYDLYDMKTLSWVPGDDPAKADRIAEYNRQLARYSDMLGRALDSRHGIRINRTELIPTLASYHSIKDFRYDATKEDENDPLACILFEETPVLKIMNGEEKITDNEGNISDITISVEGFKKFFPTELSDDLRNLLYDPDNTNLLDNPSNPLEFMMQEQNLENELTRIGKLTERDKVRLENRKSDRIAEEFLRDERFSEMERPFIAKQFMVTVSSMLDYMYNNPDKCESLWAEYKSLNVRSYRREDLAGNRHILMFAMDKVAKKMFSRDLAKKRGIVDEFVLEKMDDLKGKYFDAIINMGYQELIKLEGKTFSIEKDLTAEALEGEVTAEAQKIALAELQKDNERLDHAEAKNNDDTEVIEDRGDNDSLDSDEDLDAEGERPIDPWKQGGQYQVSARASVLKKIKRTLEKCKIKDSAGHTVMDKYGYGYPQYVDSDMATNSLLQWMQYTDNYSEMISILKIFAKSGSNTWIYQLIDALENSVDSDLRQQFFRSFRKDSAKFSITYPDYDDNGNLIYVVKLVNTRGASEGMLNDIEDKIKNHALSILYNEDANGLYVLNKDVLKKYYSTYITALDDVYRNFKKSDNEEYPMGVYDPLISIFKLLGINFDKDNLILALSSDPDKKGNNALLPYIISNLKNIPSALINEHNRVESAKNNPEKDKRVYEDENPLSKAITDKNSTYRLIDRVLSKIVNFLPQEIESSVFEDGKMYYSYIPPSYTGKIFRNLKDSINTEFNTPINKGKFKKFMYDNYGKYQWFNDNYSDTDETTDDVVYNSKWLREISTNSEARKLLELKTNITFDKTNYSSMGDLSYLLSIIADYTDKIDPGNVFELPKTAWYRMMTISNKPVGQSVRFKTYKTDEITSSMHDVLKQELGRILDVLYVASDNLSGGNIPSIKTYDIDPEKLSSKKYVDFAGHLKEWKNVKDKIDRGEAVSEEEKSKIYFTKEDMKLIEKSGANFKFIGFLNNEIQNGTDLGNLLLKYIGSFNNEGINSLHESFDTALKNFMNATCSKIIKDWKKMGLFDTETVNTEGKDKAGSKTVTAVKHYKYFRGLLKNVQNPNNHDDDFKLKTEALEKILNDFIWNDMFATINITQLTVTDLAFFKDSDDFQKRFAFTYSPGSRFNVEAVDDNGKRLSDGYERSIILKDEVVKSEIISNISVIFDRLIAKIPDDEAHKAEKAAAKAQKESIINMFKEVNVADSEAYTCLSSYRKKARMAGGLWSPEYERIYNKIIKDKNYNISDLMFVCQPLKPFVASAEERSRGNGRSMIKSPVQQKNSEFMLFLADALVRGDNANITKSGNKLRAIFDFMEKSSEGSSYDKGIDTVQFASALKQSVSGVVDITGNLTYEEVTARLNKSVYNSNHEYNYDIVHKVSYADYSLQQEVPRHFFDGDDMIEGTQYRILSVSDIEESEDGNDLYIRNGSFPTSENSDGSYKAVSKEAFLKEYQQLIASNIKASYDELRKEFHFDRGSTSVQQNLAISSRLQRAIRNDQKYGNDLLSSCIVDKNTGQFTVPLCDPIQSVRTSQLLYSIIKKELNKQVKTGGPNVQVSCFGLSEDLNVRWFVKGSHSKLLETLKEFRNRTENKGRNEESTLKDYEKYCTDNQGSLAYFEAYLPVPNTDMEKKLLKKDGSYMTVEEALDNKAITEEMLKAIGYRIPTEDKYSILPMRIKGFIPKASGEVVILPKELTTLTGSDFDVDKLYIEMKNFTYEANNLNKRSYINALNENKDREKLTFKDKGFISMVKLIDGKNPENAKTIVNNEIIKLNAESNPDKYRLSLLKDTLDYLNTNSNDIMSDRFVEDTLMSTKRGRDNRIFDLRWGSLTSSTTESKMFNPGSFNAQKKISYIVTATKFIEDNREMQEKYTEITGKKYINPLESYRELSTIDDPSRIKDLLDSNAHNILFIDSQIYYHNQNMSAKVLVGAFANHNTSHAFVSMLDIEADFSHTSTGLPVSEDRQQAIHINGHTVSTGSKLDAIMGFDGVTRISKTIAGFLAASVDTAKDPVLNYMNINSMTASIAMTMARMGYNTEDIGLFLSQPILEKLSFTYFKNKDIKQYTTINDAINEVVTDKESLSDSYGKLNSIFIDKETLIKGLTHSTKENYNPSMDTDQIQILAVFKKFAEMSDALSDITFVTKFNSTTNAGGPNITDTIMLYDRAVSLANASDSGTLPFSNGVKDILNKAKSPILYAFYHYTIDPNVEIEGNSTTVGLAAELFSKFFIESTPAFSRFITGFTLIQEVNSQQDL